VKSIPERIFLLNIEKPNDIIIDEEYEALPQADLTPLAASLEAVLFAAGSPIATDRLCEILSVSRPELEVLRRMLEAKYRKNDSGIALIYLDGAYQLCTKPEHANAVKAALELKKMPPLSKAALEVLAIVAYNQPVTRVFIEQVRGVDSSSIVASLCDKGLIKEDGTLDAPGRPTLFSTTDAFLRCFGLSSLADLPHNIDELAHNDTDSSQLMLTSDVDATMVTAIGE